MRIKNYEQLATTELRKDALAIADAGLAAIETKAAIRAQVASDGRDLTLVGETIPWREVKNLRVVGVGKCAGEAAAALEEILGDRIERGVIVDVKVAPGLTRIKSFVGTHPLPTEPNVEAAKQIVECLKGLDENDLVIFIVSGGGSTLLCLPNDMGCKEEANIFTALTKSGATIQEINTVRKHLSLARGGYLAQYAYPARGVALIFSDVPGNDIQFIASGPTVRDATTIEEAETILSKYHVLETCGLEKCGLVETPKDEKYFTRMRNELIVSAGIALRAMAAKAKEIGFASGLCTDCLTGEAREAGAEIVQRLHETASPRAFLYSGETTVTIQGKGKGGRNQEVALGGLSEVRTGEILVSLASDGHDNTDFAGAICDTITVDHAKSLNLDIKKSLAENDAYPFFTATGDYLMTGETGSNVSDLIIALKK